MACKTYCVYKHVLPNNKINIHRYYKTKSTIKMEKWTWL